MSDQTNPSSTKGLQLAQKKKREELNKKRELEEAKKAEEKERQEKEEAARKRVQSAMKGKGFTNSNKIIAQKAKEKREIFQKQEREMKANIEKMKQAGRSRPMLLDEGGQDKARSNLARLKAAQKMVEIMKASGQDPNKFLKAEEREILEEEAIKNEMRAKWDPEFKKKLDQEKKDSDARIKAIKQGNKPAKRADSDDSYGKDGFSKP